MTTITLVPGFERNASCGETIDYGNKYVYWNGTGLEIGALYIMSKKEVPKREYK